MKKTGIIISIVVVVLAAAGVSIAAVYNQKGKFETESNKIAEEKQGVQSELDQLKADKDSNGFLPSDIVKYFMGETKAGSLDKAMLYVSAEKQKMDIKKWLNLSQPLTALNLQETTYTISGDTAVVKTQVVFENSNDAAVVRNFDLAKENSNWKIVEIRGE